jgi:hypothetical protein
MVPKSGYRSSEKITLKRISPWEAVLPSITEPARDTPIFGEFEIVVLGGGPAGIAAAAAAGALGRKTLLIERYGFSAAWEPPRA